MNRKRIRILAIETSGPTFSVALSENGKVVKEYFWHSGLKHSELLVPSIQKLLKEARWTVNSIGKIAVSTGPGSFTGIRVGLSCAKTLAQALNIPVVGIDSLDILVSSIKNTSASAFAAIDALRGEVFVKERSGKIVIKENISYWESLKTEGPEKVILGSGALKYGCEIREVLGTKVRLLTEKKNYPRAGVLALMAEEKKGKSFRSIDPLYIRRSWAEEKR